MDVIKSWAGPYRSEFNRVGKHMMYLMKQRKLVDFANEVKMKKEDIPSVS